MKQGAKPTWMTIDEVAAWVADDPNNIIDFIIEDRIPYTFHPDGISIWFEGFQMVMTELYDLEGDLRALNEAAERHTEQDVLGLLMEYDRKNRDV